MISRQCTVFRDLFDFRIFRYWLLSLVITFGGILLLAGLGILSFAALADPVSMIGIGFLSDGTNGFWIECMVSLVQVLFGALVTLVVAFVSWFSFSVTLLTVLALFNESIIREIRNKHYSDVPLITGFTFWPMLVEQIKVIIAYLAILIVGGIVGFIFIVVLSWVSIPLLMIWSFFLYRSLLLIDCGLTIFPSRELRKQKSLFNVTLWPPVVVTFGMSLIPVLNIFAPFVAVVWVSHLMLASRLHQMESQKAH